MGILSVDLVWMDLEMTGLDISKEQIIEIAVVITDGKLMKKMKQYRKYTIASQGINVQG